MADRLRLLSRLLPLTADAGSAGDQPGRGRNSGAQGDCRWAATWHARRCRGVHGAGSGLAGCQRRLQLGHRVDTAPPEHGGGGCGKAALAEHPRGWQRRRSPAAEQVLLCCRSLPRGWRGWRGGGGSGRGRSSRTLPRAAATQPVRFIVSVGWHAVCVDQSSGALTRRARSVGSRTRRPSATRRAPIHGRCGRPSGKRCCCHATAVTQCSVGASWLPASEPPEAVAVVDPGPAPTI
jgi:hypothetical protein